MKENQFYTYFGISSFVFEDLCEEIRYGIDSFLVRRGLSGVENIEFRQIITGATTASPLFNLYRSFIYTELTSTLASSNNLEKNKPASNTIKPLPILEMIEKEITDLIQIRNKLIHSNWSPRLLNEDRNYVKGFKNKILKKGSSIDILEFRENDFTNFIKNCELIKNDISFLNASLDEPDLFPLAKFYKINNGKPERIEPPMQSILTRIKH